MLINFNYIYICYESFLIILLISFIINLLNIYNFNKLILCYINIILILTTIILYKKINIILGFFFLLQISSGFFLFLLFKDCITTKFKKNLTHHIYLLSFIILFLKNNYNFLYFYKNCFNYWNYFDNNFIIFQFFCFIILNNYLIILNVFLIIILISLIIIYFFSNNNKLFNNINKLLSNSIICENFINNKKYQINMV